MHTKKVDTEPLSNTPPKSTLPLEYADYADVFSEDKAITLPDHGPHDHAIDLIDKSKPPPYGPIYNLSETELATLQAYIN